MKISLFWRVLPLHILILGVLVMPIWQNYQAKTAAAKAQIQATAQLGAKREKAINKEVAGKPNRILIPQVQIDVAIVDGLYDASSSSWSVASSAANYAPNTALANNSADQTLIYGHWTAQVFGRTKQLLSGDIAYVYTENNHILSYKFTGFSNVKPSDVEIFNSLAGKPGLVLMTCDGLWADNRRLMYFELVEAV